MPFTMVRRPQSGHTGEGSTLFTDAGGYHGVVRLGGCAFPEIRNHLLHDKDAKRPRGPIAPRPGTNGAMVLGTVPHAADAAAQG